jgi:hypothetical protein
MLTYADVCSAALFLCCSSAAGARQRPNPSRTELKRVSALTKPLTKPLLSSVPLLQVHANDLNPHSYEWCLKNVGFNVPAPLQQNVVRMLTYADVC